MGLLDTIFPQDDASGLLGFLKGNAAFQRPIDSGLPSDQAQYGGQPQYAPQPAAMNAMAQAPAPQPMPVAPQPMPASAAPVPANPPPVIPASPMAAPVAQPSPGIGDHLMAGYQSMHGGGGLIGGLIGAVTGQRNDPQGVALQQQVQQKNMTAQFLMSHGYSQNDAYALVQSGNADAITAALKQATAPKDPMNLGSGYILRPGAKAAERLFEPDDKTPTSVAEYKFYKDNLPKGQQPKSYEDWMASKEGVNGGLSLNPVYGKDANGNTVLLQAGKNGVAVQSKLPEGVTLNGVDNETLASDAARLNAGDDTILKKYSNKGQGRVDLLRLNNEANRQRQEAGQAPIDITQNRVALQGDIARERAAGNMEGRMAPAAVEAQGAFKIAREASENLARTNFVPYNKILQAGQSAFSNPELKAAATAYNTAVMTYSKAITPTGVGTVTAQEHARQILETADGPAATKAAFDQLSREVDMAHQSPALARQYFADARKAKMEGRPPPPMPEYQETGKPSASSANKTAPTIQEGATATNPQTGDKIIFRNGKWQPQ